MKRSDTRLAGLEQARRLVVVVFGHSLDGRGRVLLANIGAAIRRERARKGKKRA